MDPEVFKTPWKVKEDHFGGNVVYLILDNEGKAVAIVGSWDHADFMVSRVNACFEGLN